MKERFKNYGLWASILAFIPMLLQGMGYDVLPKNYVELCSAFLGILVLAGILSNPKEGSGFLDNKEEEQK